MQSFKTCHAAMLFLFCESREESSLQVREEEEQ